MNYFPFDRTRLLSIPGNKAQNNFNRTSFAYISTCILLDIIIQGLTMHRFFIPFILHMPKSL